MSDFYWQLTLKDGTVFDVPPTAVSVIQKRIKNREPINLKSRTVLYAEIQHFQKSERRFSSQRLLDSAAQAFREPLINEDESIVSRWVKKEVSNDRWQKYYAPQGYKRLSGDSERTVIAFRLPVHQIDTAELSYCSDDDIKTLTSK